LVKSRGANRLPTELDDVLIQSDDRKATSDPRSELGGRLALVAYRVAQDVTDLFLSATAMLPRASLKLCLHVILELPDQDLCHVIMLSRYHLYHATRFRHA
jgi:hypothetical protein